MTIAPLASAPHWQNGPPDVVVKVKSKNKYCSLWRRLYKDVPVVIAYSGRQSYVLP
jgi:hypothetical protein